MSQECPKVWFETDSGEKYSPEEDYDEVVGWDVTDIPEVYTRMVMVKKLRSGHGLREVFKVFSNGELELISTKVVELT